MAISPQRFGRIRMPVISIYIHTEGSTFKVTDDTSSVVPSADNMTAIPKSVVSFRTTNAMSDDSATFSIVLGPKDGVLWDRVINENDLIELYADSNEDLLAHQTNQTPNTAIMVGLVSQIDILGNHYDNSKMYQITGQSIAKVFSQYKIGLVSQVEQQLSPLGWLWDSAINEDYYTSGAAGGGSDSSDSGDSSGDSGTSVQGGNGNNSADAEKAGNRSDYHESGSTTKAKLISLVKQIGSRTGINWKFLAGQLGAESGFGNSSLARNGNNYTGIKYANQAHAHRGSWATDDGGYYAYFDTDEDWAVNYAQIIARMDRTSGYKLSHAKTVGEYASALRSQGYYTAPASQYAKLLQGVIDGLGENGGSTSTGGSDSTSDSGSSGMSEAEIAREKQDSEGMPFYGNNVAGVESALLNRFSPYIKLTYDGGAHTIWNYIDASGMQSWTDYESMKDSSSFVNFTGSLYELQKALLRQPFNEMFYDFNSKDSGGPVAKLIVRRTPFNPEDWYALDMINLDSTNVLSENISKTDMEQYSVFVDNPATGWFSGYQDSFMAGSYPRMNRDLINVYGYSKLEVSDYYVSGSNDKDWSIGTGSGQAINMATKSTDNGKGDFYSYKDVVNDLGHYSHTAIDQRGAAVSLGLANEANNISGEQASELVAMYKANGYQLSQQNYDDILDTANGGGQPNTGTHKMTYNKVREFVKSSKNVADFLTKCKPYFKNESDERLRAIYSGADGGDITKSAYDKAIKGYTDAGRTGNNISDASQDTDYFQVMLYNWYANNCNFWSGTYTVLGNANIRLGMILNYTDNFLANKYKYPGRRFYIESVSHNFSFTDGFTTDIGVTRGLIAPTPIDSKSGDPRFTSKYMWGTSSPYLGGYMGEAATNDLAMDDGSSSDDSDSSSNSEKGPAGAVKAEQYAEQFIESNYKKKNEIYSMGAGHGSTNPFDSNPLVFDCSGFVEWCFRHENIELGHGNAKGMLSLGIFKHVSIPKGSCKGMKVGDVIVMNHGTHVMIYAGDNNYVGWNGSGSSWDPAGGCRKAPQSKYLNHDGVALRLKG